MVDEKPICWEFTALYPDRWQPYTQTDDNQPYTLIDDNTIPWQMTTNNLTDNNQPTTLIDDNQVS